MKKNILANFSKIKSTAKLDGFRKGHVPNDVLKQRYGDSIHYEVLNELIQESYPKELQEQDVSCILSSNKHRERGSYQAYFLFSRV